MAKPSTAVHINAVPAISNVRFEFMTHRFGNEPVPTLFVRGCRGERVSAAFYISGLPVKELLVTSTRPDIVDLRWIKWWWQAGRTNGEADRPQYIPEVLLHDGNLVKSSPREIKNVYPELPDDAKTLQPLDCDDGMFMPGFEQGVMVTVTIPKDAKSTTHLIYLTVTAKGERPVQILMNLYVYPFDLPKPRVDYSMYYRPRLREDPIGVDPEWRTEKQMFADLKDFVAHGVTNPCTSVGVERLDDVLRLRRDAGCDTERYFTGAVVGPAVLREDFDRKQWPQLKKDTEEYARSVVRECQGYGVKSVYAYCKDEAQRVAILKQAPLWRAARKGGLSIYGFVGGMSEEQILKIKGNLQDVLIRSGTWPTEDFGKQMAAAGIHLYVAGKPGGGNEDPEGQRRHQGLLMFNRPWIVGSMEYAYMHVWTGAKHPWDDFGCPEGDHYRSHMFAYPTLTGEVDTLQWEGFAAGINDYRYLQLLEEKGKRCSEARDFLRRIRLQEATLDLYSVRDEAARLITQLG